MKMIGHNNITMQLITIASFHVIKPLKHQLAIFISCKYILPAKNSKSDKIYFVRDKYFCSYGHKSKQPAESANARLCRSEKRKLYPNCHETLPKLPRQSLPASVGDSADSNAITLLC